jgi:hypothetical protein
VPLSFADALVQPITSGGVNATSAVTSLGSATTAGNTILIAATTYGATGITTPSGYTRDTGIPSGNAKVYVFRKSNCGASETLPTLATGASTQKTSWFAFELSGLDLTAPLDVAGVIQTATDQSITSPAATGTGYDAIGFALFLAQDATSTTPPTWSGHGGNWQEVAEQGTSDATTSTGASLAVYAPLQTLVLTGCQATSSLAANGPLAAVGVKYMAAGAKTAPDYRMLLGFEWGTSAGLTTGMDAATAVTLALPPVRLLETKTGTVTVTSATPRNGSYCLEIGSGSSGVHNATAQFAASSRISVFFPFRFATLPATDTELCSVEAASGVGCVVRFIAATSKVGVKIGTAAEQVSAGTITAATWHTIDLDYDMAVANNLATAWQLDGADQPTATHTTAGATTAGTLRLGWTAASAAVLRVDDVIVAGRKGNWPLGDHRVVLVGVDPAATPSVSGTANNFRRFTANGTIDGAWNATDVRNAIDEVPPTIGASADGVVQVTAAGTDYAVIPMATYTAAANEVIRAVRLLVCGWAAASQAKTLQFRMVNPGVESLVVFPVADPLFTTSTTDPAWLCRMVNPTGGWTQAWLDAAEVHMGASDDATPDVGMHAPYAEVAVAVAPTQMLFGSLATQALDPLSGGILGVTVETPAGQGTTLNWVASGTPGSQAVAADSTHTEVFDAVDSTTVTFVEVVSDAEPEH